MTLLLDLSNALFVLAGLGVLSAVLVAIKDGSFRKPGRLERAQHRRRMVSYLSDANSNGQLD